MRINGKIWFVIIVAVLIVSIIISLRIASAHKLEHSTEEQSIPTVVVMQAQTGPAMEELVLPGNVEAWHQATIYARTNGYVKDWYKGLGARVKKGTLLAEIETPELDAQFRQAEADLNTAEANNQLAQTTAKRWKALLKTDSVSKQETDEKVGDAAAKFAALASARANRDHLRELEGFKRVVAPFDGIITSRTLDIGMLVNDGTFGQFQSLFHIVQADRLRIYVKVPEIDSDRITPDITAELRLVDHPGKSYPVNLYKTADAIDQASRTFLTEFMIENQNSELFAGSYAEVHILLPGVGTSVRLPVNTLLFRSAGMQVATLDANNHVVLKSITVGRDYGNDVEIVSGVAPGEAVVVNPPDSLADGQQVRIAPPAKDDKKTGDDKKPTDDKKTKDDKKS